VILFVTSIASYHETLPESEDLNRQNRLLDALLLFRDIVENKMLDQACLIIFLNKIDLLESLMERFPVRDWFPKLSTNITLAEFVKFISMKFRAQISRSSSRTVVVHPTCCTDTKSIEMVVSNVVSNVLRRVLASTGFI
jgi:hypothetical protein